MPWRFDTTCALHTSRNDPIAAFVQSNTSSGLGLELEIIIKLVLICGYAQMQTNIWCHQLWRRNAHMQLIRNSLLFHWPTTFLWWMNFEITHVCLKRISREPSGRPETSMIPFKCAHLHTFHVSKTKKKKTPKFPKVVRMNMENWIIYGITCGDAEAFLAITSTPNGKLMNRIKVKWCGICIWWPCNDVSDMDLAAYSHSVAGKLIIKCGIIFPSSLKLFIRWFRCIFFFHSVSFSFLLTFDSFLFVFGFVVVGRCIVLFGRSYCSSVWYCFRHDDHMEIVPFFGQAKAIERSQRAANYIQCACAHFVGQRNI